MTPRGAELAGFVAALALAGAATASAAAYRDGPPPGHTGGFGEPLCTACHMDAPVNPDGGSLELEAPAAYEPGVVHSLRIVVRDPRLAAGGFQLTVRHAGGSQAGTLEAAGPGVAVFTVPETGVQYASHTARGNRPVALGRARWNVRWTAPADAGLVTVHVVANAANDDGSEFGDRIYTVSRTIPPADK